MDKCLVCNGDVTPVFTEKILGKYDVAYHQCKDCLFLQTEKPYWLDEAYSSAIAISDTGLVSRNFSLASKLASLLYFGFNPRLSYIDVAGGYGMLTRLMRDCGFDYYWDDKFCQNTLARGFEYDKAFNPLGGLSAFEVLEHVHDPLEFIGELIKKHGVTTFIFSTLLYTGDSPPDKNWWYYSFETGQHISFYHEKTIKKIGEHFGLDLFSIHGIHILTRKKIRNRWLLPIAGGRLAPIFALWARYRLGSRTWKDSLLLKNTNSSN